MIGAAKNTPISKGPFNNLGRELVSLAKTMESKGSFGMKYPSPCFPGFLWRLMAEHAFWRSIARKNNLTKQDMLRRIV
jgi:hypothetical protein